MTLIKEINEIFLNAFKKAEYEVEGNIVKKSDRPDLSQFQCNSAFELARKYRDNPRNIATKVLENIEENDKIQAVTVEGPGFINIVVKDEYIAEKINENAENIRLGKKIMIDYGGPNVAKPLHVGHLRSAIIGEGLKRLAKKLGNEVIGDIHLGDWGRQMGLVICEIKERMPDLVYFDENYTGEYPEESPVTAKELEEIYPVANMKAKEDEAKMEEAREATAVLQNVDRVGHRGYYALWQRLVQVSINEMKKDYNRLNVEFDLWKGESDSNDTIPEVIEFFNQKGLLQESQGATIMEVTEETDTAPVPPVIVRTQNDSVGYQATDLATIMERMRDYNPDEIWYVVDARQSLHFKQIFRAAYKSELVPSTTKLEFFGFGTMNGKDGKPFKTRDGGVMRLTQLLDTAKQVAREKITDEKFAGYSEQEKEEIAEIIAMASIKYADAVSDRLTDYIFDVDKFTEAQGKTGPYMLYSTVRIKSLIAKAQELGIDCDGSVLAPNTDIERQLMLKMLEKNEMLMSAYNAKSLTEIAEYLYELNSLYSNFYNNNKILIEENEEKRQSWISLSKKVKEINEELLDILSIKVPERM